MVENPDAEEFPSGSETAREFDILHTWGRIPGRMVMGEEYGCSRSNHGSLEDFARMDDGR
jgi:hypothetical protein